MKHIIITSLDMYVMGGVERSNSQLAKLFRDKGHKVTLISFFKGSEKPFFDFGNNKIKSMCKLPHGTENNFSIKIKTLFYFFKMIFFLNRIKNDYVVISSYPRTSILFSIFFPKRNKVIAHEHSSYEAHGKFVSTLRKITYKRLKKVVTLTDHDKNIFDSIGINASKIPNFCDYKNNEKKQNNSNEKFQCLSAGRLHPHKGFDRLIHIASYFINENIIFNIIGSGPEENKIKMLIQNEQLEDIINLIPSTNTLDAYLKKSNVFLMTSITEAAPLVILESFAYSVPVISFDCPVGPRELIVNERNGFLIPDGNFQLYVKKLKSLMSSQDICNHLAKGASEFAKLNSSDANYKLWSQYI
jgi:glycosyltransferase involved in cell wall biosynthesis